jgi:hypothetical protein
MNDNNSCLVNYKKIKPFSYAGHNIKGQLWAEPEINSAVYYMKKIIENSKFKKKISKKAKNSIKKYSLKKNTETILNLLNTSRL